MFCAPPFLSRIVFFPSPSRGGSGWGYQQQTHLLVISPPPNRPLEGNEDQASSKKGFPKQKNSPQLGAT
ncbi:hypothetical protein DYC52_07005 [Vibrio cholerae]|nr:hypothetical protein [Vibrio cholerae]